MAIKSGLRAPGSKRAMSLVLAVAVAAAGTWGVAQYVRGLEAAANEGAELVEVYIADGLLPAGASAEAAINAGLVRKDEVLRRTLPAGAVGSLEDLSGLVLLTPVLEGEILLAGRFGPPSEAAVAFEIPEGMQAMSVEVDVPTGVANIIQAGDRVSLIAHVERESDDTSAEGEATEALGVTASSLDRVVVQPGVALEFKGGWAQYILQQVEVLAIGRRVQVVADTESGGATESDLQPTEGSVMMTLAVTPEQAERLALAIFEADLYATLLPQDSAPVETTGVTLADLFR